MAIDYGPEWRLLWLLLLRYPETWQGEWEAVHHFADLHDLATNPDRRAECLEQLLLLEALKDLAGHPNNGDAP